MSQAHLDAFRTELRSARGGTFTFKFKEEKSSLQGLLAYLEAQKLAPAPFPSVAAALQHCANPNDGRLTKYKDAVRNLVLAWGRLARYPNLAGVQPIVAAPVVLAGANFNNCYSFALRATTITQGPKPEYQAWPGSAPPGDVVATTPLTKQKLVAAVRRDSGYRATQADWATNDLGILGTAIKEPPADLAATCLVGMLHNSVGFHFIRRDAATRRWSWKQGAGDPIIYCGVTSPAREIVPLTDVNMWDVMSSFRGYQWFYSGMTFDCFFHVPNAGVATLYTR